MVLPAHLVGPITLSKGLADTGSSVMDQIAFARFLTSGGYDRHLRQMRRRYLTRRKVLLRALTRYVPEATVLGAAAGVHLTVRFPDGFPIAELVDRAARKRVRIEPLTPCYAESDSAPPGLILGYANLTESQIDTGVQALAAALRPTSVAAIVSARTVFATTVVSARTAPSAAPAAIRIGGAGTHRPRSASRPDLAAPLRRSGPSGETLRMFQPERVVGREMDRGLRMSDVGGARR